MYFALMCSDKYLLNIPIFDVWKNDAHTHLPIPQLFLPLSILKVLFIEVFLLSAMRAVAHWLSSLYPGIQVLLLTLNILLHHSEIICHSFLTFLHQPVHHFLRIHLSLHPSPLNDLSPEYMMAVPALQDWSHCSFSQKQLQPAFIHTSSVGTDFLVVLDGVLNESRNTV